MSGAGYQSDHVAGQFWIELEKTAEDVVAAVLEDEETRSLNNDLAVAFTFSSFVNISAIPLRQGLLRNRRAMELIFLG